MFNRKFFLNFYMYESFKALFQFPEGQVTSQHYLKRGHGDSTPEEQEINTKMIVSSVSCAHAVVGPLGDVPRQRVTSHPRDSDG